MTGVGVWVRTVLRQRWRATIVLSLLIGIAGAAALGAADGARRTQTALPRLREAAKSADLLVSAGGTGLKGFYAKLQTLPGVESVGMIAGIPIVPFDKDGKPNINAAVIPNAVVNNEMMVSVERPKIIAGRTLDQNASDEALVNLGAARVFKVHVGSTIPMFLSDSSNEITTGVRVSLRIVGIIVEPQSVVPTTPLDAQPKMALTPAFFR
ncbi:MAG TPA: hypothetical protein VGW79_05175, partial [Actinomycetota bacterium]|nr:hypothetical protein [Actinomycetota bacterium]